jgi:hypothetical protein
MATDRTKQKYAQYGGQRIADLTEGERAGIEGFSKEYGRYDEDFDKARGALDSVSSFTDEGVADKYMNPYVEQVLGVSARNLDRDFGTQKAELRRTAGMRGAFGGRQNVAETALSRQRSETMSDMWTQGMGTAYDKATALHGQEQDRQLALAGEYGNVAKSQADTNAVALRNMMDSGLVERSQEQADLDFKYLEHLEERDWDVGNLDVLVKTLAQVPHDVTESGESTETTKTKANPVKTLVGMAAITAGAIMTGGMSLVTMGGAMTSIGTSMMPGSDG